MPPQEILIGRIRRFLRRDRPSPPPPAVLPPCLKSWPVEEENCVGSLPTGPVRLRRYPFPYRCAMAISNDTDMMSAVVQREWHAFVNGQGASRYGDGLGLEVGDSFWVWSWDGCFALLHGTPAADNLSPSPEFPYIRELARAGWLDTLHGYGNWANRELLDRDRARFALDLMEANGIKPSVWINHGHGFDLVHNIGGPWGYYQHGDVPGHPSYTLDLLRDFGFRYFWMDAFYDLEKYGDHHVYGSQAELDAAVAAYDFGHFLYTSDRADFNRARPVFVEPERAAWRRKMFNRTLVDGPAEDGSRLWYFKRFCGDESPTARNFAFQVNFRRLDELEARQGTVIPYQHFGVHRAICTPSNHVSFRPAEMPVFDENTVWAFRELAERVHSGRILLATTARLLTFLWMRDHLIVEVGPGGRLLLKSIECPVRGHVAPSLEMLNGLAFLIPEGFPDATVGIEEQAAPLPFRRVPAPEEPGMHVLHLPWQPLEWPGGAVDANG
jgi:hypothetical protein